ncbi:MAG TPA: EAL domain-containing protein [Acidimicrobiales bacterium]|nr:EAL domain-containing protein [Acidimicrobiales bacterium]
MGSAQGGLPEDAVALLRLVLETAGEGVYATDAEGRCTYLNAAGALMFRIDAGEALGRDVHRLHHGAGIETDACSACTLTPIGGQQRADDLFRAADGTVFPVAYTLTRGGEPAVTRVVVFNEIRERKRVEAALRQSELKFRAVTESANDAIVSTDTNGNIVAWNRAASEMFGYTEDEVIDEPFAPLLPGFSEKGAGLALEQPKAAGDAAGSATVEAEGRRKDGSTFPLELSVAQWKRGDACYFTGILRDITDRKRAEAELARGVALVQLLESVALAANEASDPQKALQFAVTRICAHSGWGAGHAYFVEQSDPPRPVASEIWHLGDPKRFRAFRRATSRALAGDADTLPPRVAETSRPVWMPDVTAEDLPARIRMAAMVGFRSAFALPVLAGRDLVALLEFFAEDMAEPHDTFVEVMGQIGAQLGRVVERQRAEEQLTYHALHDELTGLPNRVLFFDRLTVALGRARRHAPVAVLFLDLDRFKLVNDSLGHDAGDQLLVQVAARLSSALRESDTIARFGGDEFVVLCEDVVSADEVVGVAERLSQSLAAPIALADGEVFITTSIGIAFSEGPDQTPQALLRDADAALYRAKELGRGGYELFNEQMRARAVERLATVNALHRAIERDELLLYYQPIVELVSGSIVGMEALVRWQHHERGLVPPTEFIPLAEESGLIVELGRWVLREACAQARRWSEALPGSTLTMSVNLSARELQHPMVVEEVADALASARVDPRRLVLEITESVLMNDTRATLDRLQQLRDLGVRLAIDDFGTGYSSLASLRRLPVDVLKIDKSFIDGLGVDRDESAITRTVVRLAQALGLETVAEGVERAEVAAELLTLGCHLAQGYHFSRPLPAAELDQLLRSQFDPTPARRGKLVS